ncbi:MAG TPA: hypothetical protein DDW30_09795 [Clostridiales bacterium]|nr:hypothetical protein [Clostridiales bacterium]
MKKAISVLCLFAMLLSLAAVMSVGTSAMSVPEGKSGFHGVYVAEGNAPKIDGDIDKVWENAPAMPFGKAEYGYIKVMWTGTTTRGTLYMLAEVNGSDFTGIDFVLSSRFYSIPEATWDNETWKGSFDIHIDKTSGYDKTGAKAWKGDKVAVPSGTPSAKTTATENGFIAEVAFTMSSANAVGFKCGGFFGIGAFISGDDEDDAYTKADNAVGMDVNHITESPSYLYAINMRCNSKEHTWTSITTEPTLTTTGKGKYYCTESKTTFSNADIPVTTIQWRGVQTLENLSDGTTTTSMRLVSQIKDLDAFSAVGYEITASTGTALDALTPLSGIIDKDMTSVYNSITAAGKKVEPEDGGKFLVAIVVDDIPLKDANGNDLYVSFTVKPYTVDTASNKVYMTGTDSVTFVLKAGVLVTE